MTQMSPQCSLKDPTLFAIVYAIESFATMLMTSSSTDVLIVPELLFRRRPDNAYGVALIGNKASLALHRRTTWFLRKAAASSLGHRLVCRLIRSVVAFWFASPRTPPLWQRDFFLVNCSQLRRFLASERSGVVKTSRCATWSFINSGCDVRFSLEHEWKAIRFIRLGTVAYAVCGAIQYLCRFESCLTRIGFCCLSCCVG